MKIEKLTDNKIRVIISLDDFKKNNIDVNSFLEKNVNPQGLLFDILKKAEEEVDFHTDGCKLLIEAYSSSDDIFVFTITKFSISDSKDFYMQEAPRLSLHPEVFPHKSYHTVPQCHTLPHR